MVDVSTSLSRLRPSAGIALGPILFIIAILAVLAAAIAAGSGGFNANITTEGNKAAAEAIINYADQVSVAVQKLYVGNACAISQINFNTGSLTGYTNPNAPADGSCNVFNHDGGGILYMVPPSAYLDNVNTTGPNYGQWVVIGNMKIAAYAPAGDVIILLPYIPFSTCQLINNMVGFSVTTTSNIPWVNSVHTVLNTPFAGTTAYSGSIVDNATVSSGATAAAKYQPTGCLWFDNWNYNTTSVTPTGIFYKVLIQQ